MTWLWLLNPDAEIEISHHAEGRAGPYTTPSRALRSMKARTATFRELTTQDAFAFHDDLRDFEPRSETRLLPWCPTPSVVATCRRRHLRLPRTPTMETIIRANDKTRLESWGLRVVPGRTVVESESELESLRSSTARLRLKRPFGFAGRGQRQVTDTWSDDDRRWIHDSLARGPLVVEPELSDPMLASVHLMLAPEQTFVGMPLCFACDPFGAFLRWTERIPDGELCARIAAQASEAARRLLDENYLGPASIDFALGPDGSPFAIDLNARFSLGWSRGMGASRQKALELYWAQPSD